MGISEKYKQQIYAGVLGKMIGVYLGRPVEGWPYQSIQKRFGEIPYYINEELSLQYDRNPIESIKTRVKSFDSILKKVKRKQRVKSRPTPAAY